jgi:hypothetical protein
MRRRETAGLRPGAPARRRPRPARGVRGLPAVRVACLDARGIGIRSHQPDDIAEAADLMAAERAIDLALGIADALAAELAAASAAQGAGTAAG